MGKQGSNDNKSNVKGTSGWNTYSNDGTSSGSSGMLRPLQDILARKAPMSPSKISDLIERAQIHEC
jgi:hypothetical protein